MTTDTLNIIAVLGCSVNLIDDSFEDIPQRGSVVTPAIASLSEDKQTVYIDVSLPADDPYFDSEYTVQKYGIRCSVHAAGFLGKNLVEDTLVTAFDVPCPKEELGDTITTKGVIPMITFSNHKQIDITYYIKKTKRNNILAAIHVTIPTVYFNEWLTIREIRRDTIVNGIKLISIPHLKQEDEIVNNQNVHILHLS